MLAKARALQRLTSPTLNPKPIGRTGNETWKWLENTFSEAGMLTAVWNLETTT